MKLHPYTFHMIYRVHGGIPKSGVVLVILSPELILFVSYIGHPPDQIKVPGPQRSTRSSRQPLVGKWDERARTHLSWQVAAIPTQEWQQRLVDSTRLSNSNGQPTDTPYLYQAVWKWRSY